MSKSINKKYRGIMTTDVYFDYKAAKPHAKNRDAMEIGSCQE
jgi:hypothetical protein